MLGVSVPVLAGQRNSTLASLAGTMRRRGMTKAEILAALLAANRGRCRPPLEESEVRRIAASIARYPPGGFSVIRFNCTDVGNAELFAALYGDLVRYDYCRKRWLIWSGRWWRADVDGEVARLAKEAARTRYHQAAKIEDPTVRRSHAQWSIRSEKRPRLEATLKLAQSERPIADAGEHWDADPWLLGVANGVVDLRTGALRAGRREDRITVHAEVGFALSAECPRWVRFLDEVFCSNTELIDFVHRAVGYSACGEVSEQVFFMLYGTGANGKTVFSKTLRYVLGPYAYDAGFSTFERKGRAAIPEDLANLARRRFVTASECAEGTQLNEARLKALAGGDTQNARFLYGTRFEYEPTCTIWLAVNHPPTVRDDSHGFWRKVRLVPFERQFSEAEADKKLDQKLRREAPGILAWVVQGCLEWQQYGLESPAAVSAATREYQAESDPLEGFITEECITEPQAEVKAAEFYQAYREWAGGQGIRERDVLSSKAFGMRMRERFEKRRRACGVVYHGVGLLTARGNSHRNTV